MGSLHLRKMQEIIKDPRNSRLNAIRAELTEIWDIIEDIEIESEEERDEIRSIKRLLNGTVEYLEGRPDGVPDGDTSMISLAIQEFCKKHRTRNGEPCV